MAAPRPSRIPELTGIRGLAACWVFAFHIWLVGGSPVLTAAGLDLTPFLACGWAGVDLFFVLSGFVLTWPYAARSPVRVAYGDFMRRRVLRVVPAYYGQFLVVLLLAAFGLIQQLPTFGNALAHLLFLHNLDFAWSDPLPKTWWTLPIEWQFYLLFPLLLLALVRFGFLRVLPALVVVVLVWRINAMAWLQAHEPGASIDYRVWLLEQLPGRIDQFFVGMGTAWLTTRAWHRLDDSRRVRWSAALVAGGLALLVGLIYGLWPRADAYWRGHWLLYSWHLFAALPLAMLIAGAALGSRAASTLMGNRPVRWLGEISYSMYLWNYGVLVALVDLGVFAGLDGPDRIVWVALYGTGPVLLVSAASWWLAERPFLHYRDPRPGDAVGRHLANFIRSPWRGVAVAGALILAILAAAQFYWRPGSALRGACTERGAVDGPALIQAADDVAHIAGWAHHGDRSDPVRRVVAVIDGRIVGEAVPGLPRPDVVAALPGCRIENPAFDLPLPVARLPDAPRPVLVEAERASGRRYRLGAVPWQFGLPRVSMEHVPAALDGGTVIDGWAWHPAGPVQVRWRLGDRVLAEATADAPRRDVAEAFPHWMGAGKSGFVFRLKPAELPRSAGETVFDITDAQGRRQEIPGPPLDNDRPIGLVVPDKYRRLVDPPHIPVSAWLFDEQGIASATVATELGVPLGSLYRVRDGEPLPGLATDVRGPPAGKFWNDALRRGSLFAGTIAGRGVPPGIQRLVVHARDGAGREAVLPGPLVAQGLPPLPHTCAGEPFTVYLWATTGMLRSGLPDLAELRRFSEGGCVRFGLHARVEYLRTTRGKAADFAFDPDFPDALRLQHGKEMTTTSLREALAMADRYRVPMRILLDGGVWADSHFAVPDYDITDWLEQDDRRVQWNQFGRAEADDALQGLAGGHDNPQLGRVMALNVYNQDYRAYKKRNLQAAVALIAEHNRRHPERPVSVTFDPDLYINPWFYLKQWYDYNPDTLRQFREWLTHTGPYADGGELAGLGRRERLDLEAINRLAGARWSRLEDVEPPRATPDYQDPWHQVWTAFKRHLVGRHYADLARWAREAGLPPEHIFTAQTFIQADVSVTGEDPATGWVDEAGVSIAGAKPADGHLGAILYGPASRNQGRPRSGASLFANVRRADPHWEVAEMNPANIERPDRLPDHGESYRTIAAIFNYGAGGMSPMWNGLAGELSVRPAQFKSYEAFAQSPWETQLLLFLRAAAALPRGSQLWTFGNAYTASDDGFAPLAGTRLDATAGELHLAATEAGATGCGMARPLDGWPVPVGARLEIAGPGLPAGSATVRIAGQTREFPWPAPAAGRPVTVDLGALAGAAADAIELRFAQCPATLSGMHIAGRAAAPSREKR